MMFPDTEMAATFMTYLIKFSLSPFITKQLADQINEATCLVIKFDESLNKTVKTKQLDLHVCYWVDDQVQSWYFGSQAMQKRWTCWNIKK